jgi:hypothetical protein
MEGLAITGDTPFERARLGRVRAELLIATHFAVKDLVEQLDECATMIDQWVETTQLYGEGKATKEELEADLILATQALKDQKLYEAALVMVCEKAAGDLGLEA